MNLFGRSPNYGRLRIIGAHSIIFSRWVVKNITCSFSKRFLFDLLVKLSMGRSFKKSDLSEQARCVVSFLLRADVKFRDFGTIYKKSISSSKKVGIQWQGH